MILEKREEDQTAVEKIISRFQRFVLSQESVVYIVYVDDVNEAQIPLPKRGVLKTHMSSEL